MKEETFLSSPERFLFLDKGREECVRISIPKYHLLRDLYIRRCKVSFAIKIFSLSSSCVLCSVPASGEDEEDEEEEEVLSLSCIPSISICLNLSKKFAFSINR